jgi:hypothetical protein
VELQTEFLLNALPVPYIDFNAKGITVRPRIISSKEAEPFKVVG